jgi:hypothetical protein
MPVPIGPRRAGGGQGIGFGIGSLRGPNVRPRPSQSQARSQGGFACKETTTGRKASSAIGSAGGACAPQEAHVDRILLFRPGPTASSGGATGAAVGAADRLGPWRSNLESRALGRDSPILDSGSASAHHSRIDHPFAWLAAATTSTNAMISTPCSCPARHPTGVTASVVGDLPLVSRWKRIVPREAAHARRACGIRTPSTAARASSYAFRPA